MVLGILGGMGPLASAEFLDTIYKLNITGPEQTAPVCLLHSDPTFPDRTKAILSGDVRELTRRLENALERLAAAGADRIVIACITVHHVLPELPDELRARVISLLDLVIEEVLRSPRPLLLLATDGTLAAGVFERQERWGLIAPQVGFLDAADQRTLHDWIYRLKERHHPRECMEWLDSLPAKYGKEGFIFGCTELHIVHKYFERDARRFDRRAIDPLLIAAREWRRFAAASGLDKS
ncbi:MAG TPA: aspartate/glutamate racemase family protein [Thermoanaerobaculia bacterium]